MKHLALLIVIFPLAVFAQQEEAESAAAPAPCSMPEYRQFDFWLGDWNVSSNGKPAGTNSIHRVHGGCALQENWQGAGEGGLSGSSFNIYDRVSGTWHQTWIDSSGTLLQLDGGLADGSMVLEGKRPARDGKGLAYHRISWTPGDDGSVRQLWEVSRDEGATWNAVFDGRYEKAAAGTP
jgi:hypothetical protein